MISIHGLEKTYAINDHSIRAVDDLTLDIEAGEIFGVIGYSGAGKSTFVRLLNRLEEPTAGSIMIDGKDMMQLNTKRLREARQDIGMIFQHFNLLWSRTTEQNIAFPLEIARMPKKERQARVKELIKLVGLEGREKAYPSQLSGGQKQRVGIARALANNPKLLLCDEATSALDPETTHSILDLLVDINKKLGLTIVLITHEMNVIRKICHRVAVMEEGKVVETGNVYHVFREPQHEVTKRFIGEVLEDGEDDETLEDVLREVDRVGKVARLRFQGTATNDALISNIAKKFSIEVNILQGKITKTTYGTVGTLVIQLIGDRREIDDVLSYIKDADVVVEVVRDDT
ncbi:MAG TPA: ATP-binding cassette domain-containing protein [Bacillota bacterium]|nr:ATP-binding cassette domain-containing protein [Bacillota bacterium]